LDYAAIWHDYGAELRGCVCYRPDSLIGWSVSQSAVCIYQWGGNKIWCELMRLLLLDYDIHLSFRNVTLDNYLLLLLHVIILI